MCIRDRDDPHLLHLQELLASNFQLVAKESARSGEDGWASGGDSVGESVFGRLGKIESRRRLSDGRKEGKEIKHLTGSTPEAVHDSEERRWPSSHHWDT